MTEDLGGGPPSPSDGISPYSKDELALIRAYKTPKKPDSNCDWCGKPYKGLKGGSRVCPRCWANREALHETQ